MSGRAGQSATLQPQAPLSFAPARRPPIPSSSRPAPTRRSKASARRWCDLHLDGSRTGTYAAGPQVQASSFTTSPGIQSETCTDTNGGLDVGFADDGDHLMFGQMNFTFGLTAVDLRVASAGSGGRVDLRIDALDGPLIASVALPVTGDGRRGRR